MLKVVGASWAQTKLSWCLIVTITLLGLLSFYFGDSITDENDGKYAATVFWSKESGLRISFWGQNNDPSSIRKGAARAYYSPDVFKNGWADLEIETQEEYPDSVQAMAAGFLEGSLSWQMIHWHWKNTVENTCVGRKRYCEKMRKFLEENSKEVKRLADKHDNDPFWHHVNLFYIQLKNLEEGWRFGVKRSRQDIDIPSIDFLWMNIMPDLKDFERKFNSSKDLNPDRPSLSVALLKVINYKPFDYVLGISSSGYYGSMLRIKKRYNFAYHIDDNSDSEVVNGRNLEFTSYPGSIFSQDDFYKITREDPGSQTTIVGTQIQNHNRLLWDKIMKLEQVLLGPRVMAANRLAVDGKSWGEIFTRKNSGTGNKQWLVLNTDNSSIDFQVFEQLPDYDCSGDVTQEILFNGYWVSSSYPYHKDCIRLSNNDKEYVKSDSAENLRPDHPIANVLHEGQQNVTDIQSMVDLMRGPDLSLISRSDLLGIKTNTMFRHFWNQSMVRQWMNESGKQRRPDAKTRLRHDRTTIIIDKLPATAVIDERLDIDRNYEGIVDLKVTTIRMEGFLAAAGPPFTADRSKVQPFQWSDSSIRHLPHNGHPDVWDFDLVETQWVW